MSRSNVLETVLLLALPASGKSEVRRFLDHLSPEQRRADFHMGPNVQLDDFPYVHLMRRIDDDLARRGEPRIFFEAPDRSFSDPRDWGTLIELLNQDHADIVAKTRYPPGSTSRQLFERFDRAASKVGIEPRLRKLSSAATTALADALEQETAAQLRAKIDGYTDTLDGKTLVIEFARGGRDKTPMPLPAPFGYRHSLSLLSPAILERAVILYVWVTPEESRRKNQARTDPNDPGSILHHGVPLQVMLNDYGVDDVDWLERTSTRPGTIAVESAAGTFFVPFQRFDNRVDKTSFIRDDESRWPDDARTAVHRGLSTALSALAQAVR
jgi:hypothetical protein